MSKEVKIRDEWFGQSIPEVDWLADSLSLDDISRFKSPVVLRNYVGNWEAVQKAKDSSNEIYEYLQSLDVGTIVPVSFGSSEIDGRIFYNDNFSDVNVRKKNIRFGSLLEKVFTSSAIGSTDLIYMASIDTDKCVPEFSKKNFIDFGDRNPLISIWIGTQTRIAAHNDLPLNLACIVAGKRRFTLFPPSQTENLYIGSFEWTPASRPVSLVDFYNPNFQEHPKFRKAMNEARVAIAEEGDALFIPSMWWHHVEAIETFNVLVNYWWRDVPSFLGTPQDALIHGMYAIRDLPYHEKEIWQELFEYYVFGDSSTPAKHVPSQIQGILGSFDPRLADRTRLYLLNRLNR